MPNYNYRKGAEFERWIVKEFKRAGYAAVRSAGSHGPVDVVAYNGIKHIAIQAKVRRRNHLLINKDEMYRFLDFSKRLGCKPIIAWKPSHTTKPAHRGFTGNAIFMSPKCFRETKSYYTISLKNALKIGISIDELTNPRIKTFNFLTY